MRAQIAFYGSTPAYRPVLELHGWGELHDQLNHLSRRQEWVELGSLITDDVLDAFALSGTPTEVAAAVQHRSALDPGLKAFRHWPNSSAARVPHQTS